MIKLLVTDLDGTLLPKGQAVARENIEAVQKAAAAGVTVSIATGRMFSTALPIARALGVDVPVVTYNGALIRRVSGETLYESKLSKPTIEEAVDFAKARGWYIQSYSDDRLLFAEYTAFSKGYEDRLGTKGEVVGWEGLCTRTENVYKMLVISENAELAKERAAAFNEHFAGRAQAFRSMATNFDIVTPKTSKAFGVQKLAEILGIPLLETMAIGDSDNDIPMLEIAGHSVAMGNANAGAKAAANYVTTNCEENGFAKAVYDYVLGGKSDDR